MNIYLDIDGVLIKKDGEPVTFIVDFLEFINGEHTVYWLTTHCQGNAKVTMQYLEDKLPKEAFKYLEKIKPTKWQTLKTEAIDFNQDFRWFDDYVMQAEYEVLKKNKASDKLILVDVKSRPEILKNFVQENIDSFRVAKNIYN